MEALRASNLDSLHTHDKVERTRLYHQRIQVGSRDFPRVTTSSIERRL